MTSYKQRQENSPTLRKKSKKLARSFSDDSLCFSDLGDSTRSLLSPLYGSDVGNLSEGPLSDEEKEKEKLRARSATFTKAKSSKSGNCKVKDQQDRIITRSLSSRDPHSSYSRDETSSSSKTKTNKSKDSSLKRTRSASSVQPSSERSITITLSSSSETNAPVDTPQTRLTWEEWIVHKTIEERRKIESDLARKKVLKEEKERLQHEKEEQQKLAKMKHQEWVQKKTWEDERKMRISQRKNQIEEKRKAQKKQMIKEQAEANFEDWIEKKRQEEITLKRRQEEEERKQRVVAEKRKRESQQAYEKWLKDWKNRPKPETRSDSSCLSSHESHQEMNFYPVPGYVNPQAWVHPVIKQNKKQGKKNVQQGPSPPLLFRNIENRQKLRRQGKTQ